MAPAAAPISTETRVAATCDGGGGRSGVSEEQLIRGSDGAVVGGVRRISAQTDAPTQSQQATELKQGSGPGAPVCPLPPAG